jgi:thiamine kinase-like enzyme
MLASQAVGRSRGDADDISGRLRAVLASIPEFDPEGCAIVELPGGLTNRNLRVEDRHGRRVVIRLSNPQAEVLGVDRDVEHRCALFAAETGIGPRVLVRLPEQQALVIEWIDGRSLTTDDLDDDRTLERIATACRRLHAGRPLRRRINMFDLQRSYLDIVRQSGYRLPPGYLERSPLVDTLRLAMSAHPEPLVPCHNDLLPANVIEAGDRLWFIDFEYAGDNEPSFELGNLWSEAALAPERLEALVATYFGVVSPGILARARLWGLMAKWGWVLWASIQDATSTVDFDFWSWGLEKWERAEAEWNGPDFYRLIDDVQHATRRTP